MPATANSLRPSPGRRACTVCRRWRCRWPRAGGLAARAPQRAWPWWLVRGPPPRSPRPWPPPRRCQGQACAQGVPPRQAPRAGRPPRVIVDGTEDISDVWCQPFHVAEREPQVVFGRHQIFGCRGRGHAGHRDLVQPAAQAGAACRRPPVQPLPVRCRGSRGRVHRATAPDHRSGYDPRRSGRCRP